MYDPELRESAVALLRGGDSIEAVSRSTGVPAFTLRYWRTHPPAGRERTCPRCAKILTLPTPTVAYAYVLGLYLGDGCISVAGDPAKGVWALRIACADAWPGLLAECVTAVAAIRPANKVSIVQRGDGRVDVKAYSRHWPCLLPQHGPGMKHQRKIELQPWQRIITSQHPGSFARGLFHSDGSRFTNRVRRLLVDGDHWYEYPRYMFTNESADILGLCAETLDELAIAWRFSRRNTISVARREAVARLDEFVGPKY
jgi:hypothetical protein